MRMATCLSIALAFVSLSAVRSYAGPGESRIVDRELRSKNFAHNKLGIGPVRKMAVYLPAGYDGSSMRHPVIYFLPTAFEGSYKGAQALLDRAIAGGVIDKVILVFVDMNTPLGSSWYVNSPVTGNWEDFIVEELVPDIDASFKTLPHRDSPG